MGGGSWEFKDYANYTTSTRGVSYDTFSTSSSYSVQDIYRSTQLDPYLKPYKVMRQCKDSEEHPNTFPVILALDVTGSMGRASVKVAQKLNEIMTSVYLEEDVKDVEFCVMAIGDVEYDRAPVQISQFESDIRIAEQLDKVWFEAGGGGNTYESYTAAWYMGLEHCELDCWSRGKKGIIITLGDELPNPYLPKDRLNNVTGDNLQAPVETNELYNRVIEKFNVYHLSVDDESSSYRHHNNHYRLDNKWKQLLGENYRVVTVDNLSDNIVDIIKSNYDNTDTFTATTNTSIPVSDEGVSW